MSYNMQVVFSWSVPDSDEVADIIYKRISAGSALLGELISLTFTAEGRGDTFPQIDTVLTAWLTDNDE